jgi:ABC-type sugar transport systems, permease components
MTLFKRIYAGRWAYFFLFPAYFFFIIFTLIPLVQGLGFSFYNVGLRERTFIGFDNFERLFDDPVFWKALVNTLLIVAGVVPTVVILSLLIAVTVFPLYKWVQTAFRVAFYLPVVASGVVLSMVWLWILHPSHGLLNYLIGLFGFEPIAWLGTPKMALVSVMTVVVTFTIGQPVILFLAGLGGIPADLYEAAMIDGANSRARFFRITLPLLKPTTLFVTVTQVIGVFQVFVVVLLLTKGGPANGTQTIVYRMYEMAFDTFQFGYASAIGLVLIIIIGVISWIQFRFFGADTEY